MDQKFTWAVTEDPLKDIASGFSLSIVPLRPPPQTWLNSTPQPVNNWTFFEGTILSVGVRRADAGIFIVGTAVLIAPGLAVTAAHLFDDTERAAMSRGELSPFCTGISNSGADMWFVRSFSYALDSDVAFMSLELRSAFPDGRAIHRAVLTTREPVVGELLTVIGFRIETVDETTFWGQLYAAAGEVEEVYPDGLVPSRPTPVVQVACETLGRMSGGAAFDRDGFLVGIISSGMTPSDAAALSYIALFPTALPREVTITWPRGVYKQPVRVLEIGEGLIGIEGRDKMRIVGPNLASYERWSKRPDPTR